jgi:hypothetical protein
MSLFAVQIRKEQASLGFLEVTGEPGAGKSTLIEFCWKLMGRDEYEGDDPNKGTVAFFARTLLQVSCLPVGLIEGKRDDEKAGSRRFDYNDLLVFFNGRSPRGTGAKTNGNETYSPPFLGSIYLMQNERIDGIPAVLERLMSLRIDKSMWSDATTAAALKIEAWPMERYRYHRPCRAAGSGMDGPFPRSLRPSRPSRQGHAQTRARPAQRPRGQMPQPAGRRRRGAADALPHLPTGMGRETLRMVDAMALDRQDSCGGDHPLVADFWDKVNTSSTAKSPKITARASRSTSIAAPTARWRSA